MLISVFVLLLIASLAFAIWIVVYGVRTPAIAVKKKPSRIKAKPAPKAEAEVPIVLELPPDLRHLPEPPVLQEAAVQILEREEIFRRLRCLELGVGQMGDPLPEHDWMVAAAVAAIEDAATQRRYSPRAKQ